MPCQNQVWQKIYARRFQNYINMINSALNQRQAIITTYHIPPSSMIFLLQQHSAMMNKHPLSLFFDYTRSISFHIIYSMHYRKYNTKKKSNPNTLINFDDFVRYRTQKERIINNPFQENWKKAIVFQELLELYKPHDSTYSPNNSIYDRRNFDNFYRHKPNLDEEDSMWENNEDYQLKKLYKMAEGINNFQEQFKCQKLTKAALIIEEREKSRRQIRVEQEEEVPAQLQKKAKKEKNVKHHKIYFQKENFKEFASFVDFKEPTRKNFAACKRNINHLQKKAVQQYGVTFAKGERVPYQDLQYAKYKSRQQAIFEKFIRMPSNQHSIVEIREKPGLIDEGGNVPSAIIKNLRRPNTSCPASPVKLSKASSIRCASRKKYFRIPD